MPATTKAELLAVTQAEFAKLDALLDQLDPALALRKFEEDTSIKDVVAHRGHWIGMFLGWYTDGQAGRTVHFPAKGYNWSQLKAFNAALRQKQAHLSWPQARALLRAQHQKLLDLLTGLDDGALYDAPMPGAKNHWSTGRWAEAAGASHYRSAAKYVRACMRQALSL